jgi:peptidoglycan hydrolase CwlO-like protein/peptidoglycan hydrolase-like protein with peptidoglycan-binding domain
LHSGRQYWQKALQTIKQYSVPRARALERELSAVRNEHRELERHVEELATERDSLRAGIEEKETRIDSLHTRISDVLQEQERLGADYREQLARANASLNQAQTLQHNLHAELAERDRQLDALGATLAAQQLREEELQAELGELNRQLTEVEQQHAAARDRNQILALELESVRSDFETTRTRDGKQIATLERRIGDIEAERNAANRQVELLETSLKDTRSQQENTQARLRELESRREEERRQVESSLDSIRDTLLRVQSESGGSRQLGRAVLAAGILFLLGALASAVTLWGVRENIRELAGMGMDIKELAGQGRDLQSSMERHFSEQNKVFLEKLEALIRESTRVEAPVMEPGPVEDDGTDKEGVASSALPRGKPIVKTDQFRKRPVHGKWGPALLMASSGETLGAEFGSPRQIRVIQANLQALGFDLEQEATDGVPGRRTQQAVDEFRRLYLPVTGRQELPDSDSLVAAIGEYARLAREDRKNYGVDSGVLAAIRLGSMRTGVDFTYLMELAAAESSFDPTKRARKSSATGLFQFKEDTWLDMVRIHGSKYGIGSYAVQVKNSIDGAGNPRPAIPDSAVHRHVLELRYNPRISALLAAEYVKYNRKRLSYSLDYEPGRTELYLTHFFGATGAISFLKVLDEEPERIAGDVFPEAASSNQNIFRSKPGRPRTVAEVYKVFASKFNTSRYEDWNPS